MHPGKSEMIFLCRYSRFEGGSVRFPTGRLSTCLSASRQHLPARPPWCAPPGARSPAPQAPPLRGPGPPPLLGGRGPAPRARGLRAERLLRRRCLGAARRPPSARAPSPGESRWVAAWDRREVTEHRFSARRVDFETESTSAAGAPLLPPRSPARPPVLRSRPANPRRPGGAHEEAPGPGPRVGRSRRGRWPLMRASGCDVYGRGGGGGWVLGPRASFLSREGVCRGCEDGDWGSRAGEHLQGAGVHSGDQRQVGVRGPGKDFRRAWHVRLQTPGFPHRALRHPLFPLLHDPPARIF